MRDRHRFAMHGRQGASWHHRKKSRRFEPNRIHWGMTRQANAGGVRSTKIPDRPAQVGGDLRMVTYPLEEEQDDEYCNVYPDVPAADPAGWREYRLRR